MIKKFLTYLCAFLFGYNAANIAPIVRDLFPEGWFTPSNTDPWGLLISFIGAIVFAFAFIFMKLGFDRYFRIDPRTEQRFVWWLILTATLLATATAVILTVWEPVYSVAMDIGYWWPVYSVALFGLWAVTHHLRHWRTA